MQTTAIEKERVIYSRFPTQAEIDAAYAVRIFIQHHPARSMALSAVIWQSGISEPQLKAAFQHQFQERLEDYWERLRRP